MSWTETPVAIVTGANTGIGRVTALGLAEAGWEVHLACRSEEKTQPVIRSMREDSGNPAIHFLKLDLASLVAVRSAAESFLESQKPLPLLINNAGVASNPGLTQDGFEWMFGVNHLGHFLFTLLLEERIKASAPARIITVSSESHQVPKKFDFERLTKKSRTFIGIKEYEVSKLANVLFAQEHARRLEGSGISTYAVHPGRVATDAWRRMPWPIRPFIKKFMLSDEEGAAPTLRCALEPELQKESGLYYDRMKVGRYNPLADDHDLARELWNRSLEWVGLPGSGA
jgi:NAD(P)-dependent dehydrogenase (short-subunit alcohol dehydrogenase family)